MQMIISTFLLRELQVGGASLGVPVFMSQWAGCARHADLTSALDSAHPLTHQHVVVAPESDLISLFTKTSKIPLGTFTMPSRDALISVEGYAEWAATKRNLPQAEYMAFVRVADTRLDKFSKPDRTSVFPAISVWHGPRIYANNIHQPPPPALTKVYDALLRLHNWYAHPEQSERLQRRATTRANGNSKLSLIDSVP
jgi:hypothetical protein